MTQIIPIQVEPPRPTRADETREQANASALDDLVRRVDDWRGHDVSTFGRLLLADNLTILRSDGRRTEYEVRPWSSKRV